MLFDNQKTRNVADVVAKILAGESVKKESQMLGEELKGDQHKIDANKNNKIDAHAFKLLRKKKEVEESDQLDELSINKMLTYRAKATQKLGSGTAAQDIKRKAGIGVSGQKVKAKLKKEEIDLDEASHSMQMANDIETYAKKLGGIDKNDMMKVASMLKKGDMKGATKYAMTLDTDPKEFLMTKMGLAEAKEPPFDMPYKKAQDSKTDKSGAVHTPMSRARDLARQAMKKQMKEEFDLDITDDQADSLLETASLDEMFPGTPEYEKKYGKAPQDLKKGEKKKTSKGEMEGTGKGVVHKRKFSEMIETYVNGDIKDLLEALDDKVELIEEPTNDEFTAELEKAKAKATGKDKANVAAAATQSVKEIDEEFDQLDERELTPGESKEKERIVKGMKKGLEGFKDRYGDRAKEVMYATATKQAMKEESDSEHYKAGHDYASDHAQDSGFKVTARARKKEMLADNPHKKGTPEHSDWHRGANDGHQMALDNM